MSLPIPKRFANFEDQTFGKLKCIGKPFRTMCSESTKKSWCCVVECSCESNTIFTIRCEYLICKRATKSCGCIRKSESPSITHGMTNTPIYRTWCGMKKRCKNNHPNYGGRGIKVCPEWSNSFKQFYKDMGSVPPGLSLDRIDVNGDYCPGNCRWADRYIQSQNRRKQKTKHKEKMITYNGITLSHIDWSFKLGGKRHLVYGRLRKGWDEIKAVSTPLRSFKNKKSKKKHNLKKPDIIGKTFDRLTVIGEPFYTFTGNTLNKNWYCVCECSCDDKTIVVRDCASLVRKKDYESSCGCARREKENVINMKTHGLSNTPEYRAWLSMKMRCKDKLPGYGEGEIVVCSEWENDFLQFYNDVGPRPEGMSLDRIDSTKGYFKENCRWADAETQSNNTSETIIITYNNESLSLSQWSRKLNGSDNLVGSRLKQGWTVEEAVSTPVDYTRKYA